MQETWLKAYESGQNISITLFDLSSAFDTISKEVFCRKLEIYGFDKTSVKWFDSYLSNRSQITMIGSSMSKQLELNLDTPQGAILSPTIFIILVSDLQLWTKGIVSTYADDTSSTVTNENMNQLISDTEQEAKKILEYMSLNCLAANEDKTAILLTMKKGTTKLEKSNPVSLQIGKQHKTGEKSAKLLGV